MPCHAASGAAALRWKAVYLYVYAEIIMAWLIAAQLAIG